MRQHDVVIHEADAAKIDAVLSQFRAESAATATLLIDRSGQLLAVGEGSAVFDTVSVAALAAGAFSSTGAMARLLGQPEFTVLFHEGVKESLHVSAVDEHTIVLAIFGERTTVGMVRLFATEASRAIGAILADSRRRPRKVGALGAPLSEDEVMPAFAKQLA
jgi:predicted regulator of Ras-like GTPase activity (Roadblock/LC7/MglB family)